MSEVTKMDASTIHSLLEFDFSRNGFRRNKENPLDCDLVIVDEASMIDTLLMYNLLKALPDKTQVNSSWRCRSIAECRAWKCT